MASSTAAAAPAGPAPAPPAPAATSLLDLPQAWLLRLARSGAFDRQSDTLVALSRTCVFLRDAVLRHRTTSASFNVPFSADEFPDELERLCTVARRSSSVRLEFQAKDIDEQTCLPPHDWTATEPHITHLLVCAMAQLGGEKPLACVKEILLRYQEQTSLVPAWLKVLCPGATRLEVLNGGLSPDPLDQPMPHQHLQHLEWDCLGDTPEEPGHMRQQLAALPSLTSMKLHNLDWTEFDVQQAARLISSTVTRLELPYSAELDDVFELPTQFPQLEELDLSGLIVSDDALALLHRLPHLQRLTVKGFALAQSHTTAAWPWQELSAWELDVDSFARLPLDRIPACTVSGGVRPSADPAAVAAVAQAVRRWGGLRADRDEWWIDGGGGGFAALLATLGPLLAALPATQQRQVTLTDVQDTMPQQLQQLGQRLPPSVATLRFRNCTLAEGAWPALLPSLPATVEELNVKCMNGPLTVEQLAVLCQAAARPIRVAVASFDIDRMPQQELQSVRQQVAGAGLVTLVVMA